MWNIHNEKHTQVKLKKGRLHTWRPIVFIQPGVQDMSIIIINIYAFKVSIKRYWSWPRQSYHINTLQETTFCYILP